MKISKRTLGVLKNFSNINNSILVDDPKSLKTISYSGNILGIFQTEEDFPRFCLDNIQQFMNVVNLYDLDNLDFDFHKEFVELTYGKSNVRYIYPEEHCVQSADLEIEDLEYDAFFILNKDTINEFTKVSNYIGITDFEITMKDGKGTISLTDTENPFSNKWEKEIEGEGNCEICIVIKNVNMIPGDYEVKVQSEFVVNFTHTELPLIYFITIIDEKGFQENENLLD